MENNIFQKIKELVEENTSIPWKYYKGWSPSINMDKLFTREGAAAFIKEYFSAGGKNSPLYLNPSADKFEKPYSSNKERVLSDKDFSIDNLPAERVVHMVSSFFIGILIEHALQGENHLTAKVDNDDGFPFPYIWFLTCLYHDIGYQFEQNSAFCNRMRNVKRRGPHNSRGTLRPFDNNLFRKTAKSLSILLFNNRPHDDGINLYQPFYYKLLGYANDIRRHPVSYSNGSVVNSSWYNRMLIQRYYAYRLLAMGVCDHGIIGGYLFLDRIIKNYVETYNEECKRQAKTPELENFQKILCDSDRPLCFCKEQLPLFHHISDCIIAHNIYKADDKRKNIYRDFGLEALIGDNFRPINYQENPLLYILSVADTLDPVKICSKNSNLLASEILKNISFTYDPGAKHISIEVGSELDFSLICKAACGLKEWTKVEVEENPGSCLSIRF